MAENSQQPGNDAPVPHDHDPAMVADNAVATVDAGAEPAAEPAEREVVDAPPPKLARHDRAQEIADRIRAKRNKDKSPEFTGDMSDPAQAYGTVGMPQEPEPDLVAEPSADAPAAEQPKKVVKLKVRHQEIEMTEEERDRAAQIGLAGQDYLNEAKRLRDEAAELNKAAKRTAQPRPHQDDDGADDVAEPSAEPRAETPAPHQKRKEVFKTLIEDIQFGNDADAAAERLMGAIHETSMEATEDATLKRQMRDDFDNTIASFKSWQDKNKDLATDKNAEAVMKQMLYDGYAEDLRNIGITDDRIPKDQDKLVDWHRFYRVKGHKVRTAEALLADTQGKYVTWRGGQPSPQPKPNDTTPPNPGSRPSHLRVAVDRTARRDAIPSQPQRASAPQQVPQAQTAGKSRAQAVQAMKAARGQRVSA